VSTTRVAVFSASWTDRPTSEPAAAMRSLAGALSRLGGVDVFVPGPPSPSPSHGMPTTEAQGPGTGVADGAFDLTVTGPPDRHEGRWGVTALPAAGARGGPPGYAAALVEAGDAEASALAASVAPDAALLPVGRGGCADGPHLAVDLDAADGTRRGADRARRRGVPAHRCGLYARVHPGAAERRHYGLRSVGSYLLVLGDRPGAPVSRWPSAAVRWTLARFARRYVVVVEGGVARVWRSRSCVEEFGVHTRMDLWILMARAEGVVDLQPGELFARECVESLRYGVPVAAPAGSAAEGLVRGGGGLCFSSTAELLACADALFDPATRLELGPAGKRRADHWYGDPGGLVQRLEGVLASLHAGGGR